MLGIKRKTGAYIGAPDGKSQIEAGDTLIVYGKLDQIEELDRRGAGYLGDRAHQSAVSEHEEYLGELSESVDGIPSET